MVHQGSDAALASAREAARNRANGQFGPLHRAEESVEDVLDPWAPLDLAPEPPAQPEPAPLTGHPDVPVIPLAAEEPDEPEMPDLDFPTVGEESGLFRTYRHYSEKYENPIVVTEFNRDLLAGLTQDDIDNRTEAYHDAEVEETRRIRGRLGADDVRLPENPSPDDLARVATNIDDAYSTVYTSLYNMNCGDRTDLLAEVYGSPDKALVALGEAVAARADELATGKAAGGAAAVEERWLARVAAAETEDRVAYQHAVAEGRKPRLEGVDYIKSPDMLTLESALDEETRQALEDLTDSYLAALNEVRPVGGHLALHEESAKPGAKIAQETAKIWPADWIEKSNGARERLHIGRSVTRGHYVHRTIESFSSRGQGQSVLRGRTTSMVYNDETRRWENGPERFNDDPTYHWEDTSKLKGPGRVMTFWRPMDDAEKTERGWDPEDPSNRHAAVGTDWIVETPDHFEQIEQWRRERGDEAGAAKVRDGWELATDPTYNDGKPFYRKPKIRQNRTGTEVVSQIKLSGSQTGLPRRDPRYPVAVHEIGHRMEYVVPNLNKMTHDWRERRVTESPADDGEVKTIYRGTTERGFRDEFVDHYVGKVYSDSTSGQTADSFRHPTEVFSMGSDSVFGGRNGGLVGLSRDTDPDPDMRAFILGCFASAGLSKRSR